MDGSVRLPKTGVPGFFMVSFGTAELTNSIGGNQGGSNGLCIEPGIYLGRKRNPSSKFRFGLSSPFSFFEFDFLDVTKFSIHLLLGFRLSKRLLFDIGFGPTNWNIVGTDYSEKASVIYTTNNLYGYPLGTKSGFEYSFQFRRMLIKDRRFSLVFGFSRESISDGYSSSNFKVGIAL